MKKVWSTTPEDPIKIQSVVEIVVFVVIFIICSFLFYRWNDVPIKDYKFQIEQIKTDTDSACQKCLDIRMAIPMTTHDDMIKDSAFLTIKPSSYEKISTQKRLSDITFLIDSMLYVDKSNFYDYYRSVRDYAENYGVSNEFSMIYGSCMNKSKELDSLYNVPFKVKEMKHGKPVFYVHTETKLPLGSFTKFNIGTDNPPYKVDSTGIVVYEVSKKNSKIITSYYSTDAYVYGLYTFQSKKKNKWYDKLNLIKYFSSATPMSTPTLLQLEDISQAYINLDLKSVTVDSINLIIDFAGATEFSAIDPLPDKITMSSIEFRDPAKLFKIRAHGLRFHAKFIELENRQTIRLFGVTAIMSGLIIIFITFVILLIFKLHRGSKSNSENNKKSDIEKNDDIEKSEKN